MHGEENGGEPFARSEAITISIRLHDSITSRLQNSTTPRLHYLLNIPGKYGLLSMLMHSFGPEVIVPEQQYEWWDCYQHSENTHLRNE